MNTIKHFEQLTDLEIITRILSGEVAMYEIIIRRYNPYLFKIGRSYGFNQPDTEDLMQDTFISAYTNLGKFRGRCSLKTWLVKIMLNQCYHKKKKLSYKNEIPSDILERTNGTPMYTHDHTHTSNRIMNNELKHILETSLVAIPQDYRMAFTLRELNGMNTREAAEALDISEANVKVRLTRAKSMLRSEIKKMYSPEEIFEFNLIHCNRIVENVLNNLDRYENPETGMGFFPHFRIPGIQDMRTSLGNWKRQFTGKQKF